jgi:propanol-preferring alcohol dehydrogenase
MAATGLLSALAAAEAGGEPLIRDLAKEDVMIENLLPGAADPALMPIEHCPRCRSDELAWTGDGLWPDFRCHDCGRCWRVDCGRVVPVDHDTSPARPHDSACDLARTRLSGVPALRDQRHPEERVGPWPAAPGRLGTMRAWVVGRPGPLAGRPLSPVRLPHPEPGPGEVLVRVRACGVCRTDLHLALGELDPRRPATVPGHEIVWIVEAVGPGCDRFGIGERLGAAWLRGTCGRCRFCQAGRENLCEAALFTGWDADGGYAELAVVPEAFAYRLPDELDDVSAAPLLCAGIVGYRALRRSRLPPGGRLGIYGFGASAHVVAQVAIAQGAEVHVMTRSEQARKLALELGVASAGPAEGSPPAWLNSAVLFAPAGELVLVAMRALEAGGTLAVAGIHLSDVPGLNYAAELFREKQLCSVTANTRADGEEFLRLAAALGVRPRVDVRPLSSAEQVLADLDADRITGAAVLVPD